MPSEFPINLVIKAVDKVTEPLRKINARIAKINEPAKRLNNAFHSLVTEAGFEQLIDRSKRLDSSITDF